MKTILFFFVMLATIYAKSQEAKGYYITLQNDTITTTYKLKHGFFANFFKGYNLYEELPVLTDSGQKMKYLPSDIKGFFIDWDGKKALFTSIPIENGEQKFFRIIALTSQLNLYEYSGLLGMEA